MKKLPSTIELSCLAMFVDNKPKVEFSLSGTTFEEVELHFSVFINELHNKNIYYKVT